MPAPLHLTPLDPGYPARLRSLHRPPSTLTVQGERLEASRAVAVVGSRLAHPDAAGFARALAMTLARAGAVVVSGGATGIDAAAHRGALEAGGRTWAVAGTGCEHCFPPEHADLFDAIGRGPGAMIWPFAPQCQARPGSFVARNRVLVALSDALVVVQAGHPSGALNAAGYARKLRKPLWVVPAPPWLGERFAGSRRLLSQGSARPLHTVEALLDSLELGSAAGSPVALPARALSPAETAILEALGPPEGPPAHLDEIASRAQAAAPTTAAALLTLALEDVVVEGPPGFYRRRNAI